ncbi:MAG: C10 family peptidase [Prevotella sp.]|nr:C10 family peptidase [Prevotella sp.]
MRKFLLSFLLLTLCVTCAVANPVTQQQALQKAKAFLVKKGMAANATLNLAYQGKQRAHQNGAPAMNACYYVFNNGSNAGFVIIAGDDCAEDVLGYADSGSFDADNIPENMQAFLDGYAEEISAARAQGLSAANNGDETVEVARQVVAPLIVTHWNQSDPYNQLCFKPDGVQCVTGCVATALAQVMYYYQWPKEATSVIPAYTSKYGDQFDALPATTFNWAKMKPVYVNTGEDDEEAEQAVAKLMRYCGQAVRMNYGPNESGGYESDIPNALKNYFGYPGNPTWQRRSGYTTEVWDELIYNELRNNRPVLYGAKTSGGGGHEFICDGYDGHGLYHINWGWGGKSDGYFRLQALRPSNQGTGGSSDCGGYSLDQDAILGVCNVEISNEATGQEEESALKTVRLEANDPTTVDYSSANGFNNVSVTFSFCLAGIQDGIDWGFGLYQDGQLLQQVTYTDNDEVGGGTWSYGGSMFRGLGKNLADGQYQILGMNRVHGTEEWLPNVGSDLIYVDVEISNGKATFTNVVKTLELSLEVTGVEQRFDCDASLSQIRVYLKNTGEADYSSSLLLIVRNELVAEEGVYIPQGGEDFVDFFFPAQTGNVMLVVARDRLGNAIYTNSAFPLEASGGTAPTLTASSVAFKNFNSDNTKMYGTLLDGTVTLKNTSNTDFEGNLTLKVNVFLKIEDSKTYYIPKEQLIPVSIKAGKEKTITIPYSALAIGDKFKYQLTDPSGTVLASISRYAEVVPGVVYWKGNGERYAVAPTSTITVPDGVAAVSLEDLDMSNYDVDLSENFNSSTIYYVSDDEGFNKISAANVVVNGQALGLLLLDAQDFFVPKRFFVTREARYTCLPEIGADGKKGWQTITLPFPVEKVTSGDKVVDWYHGNDTEEKDFWVREFKQVVGNTVKFADAETWVPNVPYIFAVPGDHWGAQYDMTNKLLEFSATNVWVEKTTVSAVVSDSYEFIGISGGTSYTARDEEYEAMMKRMENAYVLNDAGSAFVKGSTCWQGKHNLCYFTINDRTIDPPAQLNIGIFDETDGICMPQVTATDGQQVDVYTVDGMKVATVTVNGGKADIGHLPKGVYIVEGKKIVR